MNSKLLLAVLLCCLVSVTVSVDVRALCSTPLSNAVTASGYCAYTWASGLGNPRGIITASNDDVLYVDQSSARIYVLWESGGNVSKAILASASGLNHALQINGKYLYASSPTTVYRWSYTAGQRSNLGTGTVVVNNVPCCHHVTRGLAFDSSNALYVQSGSNSNVDPDSSHSQIRKFNIANIPNGGINWSTGELFVDGVRNEAGIRFDNEDQLWGVENGCDDLNRADLGGDIHNDNPSEEMNLFKSTGKFYGYPYCWSEGILAKNNSNPTGTQWVHPNFMNDGIHSDAWCRNTANVVPPAYNFPAHSAPLDILFYYGATFNGLKGDAFVAFHGSWDRQPPQGYNVLHVKFSNGLPVSHNTFLAYKGPGATGPGWPHRPVALTIHKCGGTTECLLVTSDASGVIIAILPNP